jgi:hypothetical protein
VDIKTSTSRYNFAYWILSQNSAFLFIFTFPSYWKFSYNLWQSWYFVDTKMTTHLHLVPSLRIRVYIPPIPHTPEWRCAELINKVIITPCYFILVAAEEYDKHQQSRKKFDHPPLFKTKHVGSSHTAITVAVRWRWWWWHRHKIFLIFIILSGVRLSPLGTAVTTGLLYQPQMIDDGDCGAIGGMKIGRGNPGNRRKSAPAPLCPPQIPYDLTRARTRVIK